MVFQVKHRVRFEFSSGVRCIGALADLERRSDVVIRINEQVRPHIDIRLTINGGIRKVRFHCRTVTVYQFNPFQVQHWHNLTPAAAPINGLLAGIHQQVFIDFLVKSVGLVAQTLQIPLGTTYRW